MSAFAVTITSFEDLDVAASSRDRRGDRATVVERVATSAGVMPPLHARDEDESYHILEGELTFFVGDAVFAAAHGDVVALPAGVARTYRVESSRARWLVVTRVASPNRYDDFGRALARPASGADARWPSAEEAASVRALAAVNGIVILGPPGSLPQHADELPAA